MSTPLNPQVCVGKTESVNKARVAVLVGSKGRGSNLGALIEATSHPDFPAQVTIVVTPVADSPAAQRALAAGIEVCALSPNSEGYAKTLLATVAEKRIDYLCLAGLMTKLPPEVVERYAGKILNIHPALLPKFGGKGMYGHYVHEAVIASKDTESGCTVHLVTHEYDEGPIVLQLKCPVSPSDTPETLAARVLELEHQAYPQALRMVIERGQ